MNKIIAILLLVVSSFSYGQNLEDLESYTVEQFYKKVELEYGTLDENENPIKHIFVKTNIDVGTYEIEITDGRSDLYEVEGTNIYIKFMGVFGIAGYAKKCIMKVSNYSATVYKLE